VKCGEEKPVCVRCIKFGVPCDGYATRSSVRDRSSKGGNSRPLLPKSGAATISITPMKLQFANEGERNYFEMFCSKTAFEILPNFEVEVLRLMLLQACESESGIRNGIVAIGALDKTSQTARNFEKLSYSSTPEEPNEHYHNALRQYAKALKQMRQVASSGNSDLRTMLLTCLVILCFEAWNGSHQLAVQQIQTAIGLIADWKVKTGTATRSLLEFISPNSNILDDQLIQIFSQLAIQVVFFAEKRSVQTGQILQSESRPPQEQPMPEVFGSFREAFLYHRNLTRRSTHFLSRSVPKSRSKYAGWLPSDEKRARDFQFEPDQASLIANTLHWTKAFEPVLKSFTDITALEWRKSRILRVQMLVTYSSLRVMSTSDETVYDASDSIFQEIADISAEVVTAMCHTSFSKTTNFSFDAGIIIPLYLTVMKCRNVVIRRETIALLLKIPWREGIWDSFFVGNVGRWAMVVEEEFLMDNYIPGWARISGVVWSSDLHKRTAVLTCQQRTSASSALRVRTKTISW
jgi:hypothetical protein